MSLTESRLRCDMEQDCPGEVTHMDEKGYAYCRSHGDARKRVCRCRQLTVRELRALTAGQAIHYSASENRRLLTR